MRRTMIAIAILQAGRAAEAGEDKYLLVAYDAAYERLAEAEGYGPRSHLRQILTPLREYLSDSRRFWLTFRAGFKFGDWESPAANSSLNDFLYDLRSEWMAWGMTPWALVVGLTGKPNSAGRAGVGLRPGRHSVVFYRHVGGSERAARGVGAHEIGHNFSGVHHGEPGSVPQNGPCPMASDDAWAGVYRYCPNHEAQFTKYQRDVGTGW